MSPRPALPQEVIGALARWQSLRKGRWSLDEATEVQSGLLGAIDLAMVSGREPLARSLSDLALYLGFLIDGDSAGPNDAQREKLAALEQATLGTLRAERAAIERPPVSKRLLVLAPDTALWRSLIDRLNAGDYRVERYGSTAQLLSGFKADGLVAVLVDQDFLSDLGAIAARLESSRGAETLSATMVFVNRGRDLSARIRALSTGADASLEGEDLDYLVARVGELVEVRQRQDNLRVLIVEDDRSQAMYCAAILRKQGIDSQVANDSRQVLDQIRDYAPDLVLMDLHMPVIDGMQLTALIREAPELAMLPIVFVTGEQDEGSRFDALRAGGDDYLVKPVRPLHLVTAVVTRARRARSLRLQFTQRPPTAPSRLLHAGEFIARLRTLGVDRPCHWALLLIAADDGRLRARDAHLVVERENQFQIAAQLQSLLHEDEYISPWHGGAFLMLVDRTPDAPLQERAEALRMQVATQLEHVGGGGVSVAVLPLPAESPPSAETLIDLAERTIAVARHAGGRRVKRALADVQSDLPADLSLAIHKALVLEVSPATVSFLYQPIVPLHGVVRAQYHLHMGLRVDLNGERVVTRRQWLSLARQMGRLNALDEYAVAQALDRIVESRQRSPGLRIFVAVNAEALIEPGFRKALLEGLSRRGMSDSGLVLSIDHSEALLMMNRLGSVRAELRAAGVALCFGRSNLEARVDAAIEALRPELIAVDATATRSATQTPPVLAFARDRGAEIVAHFIPDAQTLARLFALGVDYGLGGFIGPPAARLDYEFGE